MRLIPVILILLVVTVHSPARGGSGDEDKKIVIANMKTANEATTSLQAKLKQRKISSFMEKELTSRAEFFYQKPGQYALKPSKDEDNQYIVNGKEVWLINKKNKSVTVTNESELNFNQYIMGFGNSIQTLETYFDVKVEPKQAQKKFNSYKIQLIPQRSSQFYDKMEKIIIYVRDDLWLPFGAELYEADGDITIWEFTDFKLNQKIKDDVFKQEVPKGFQVKKYEKNK